MISIDGKNFLTVRDVIEKIKCSEPTVFRLINSGRIKKVKVAGRTYIEESQINQLFFGGDHE